jgi:uncharacterized protein (DUF4415 family)
LLNLLFHANVLLLFDCVVINAGSFKQFHSSASTRISSISLWFSQTAPGRKAKPIAGLSLPEEATGRSENYMTNASKKQSAPSRGRANLPHLRRLTDAEINRTAPPELVDLNDDFWKNASLVLPVAKRAISLRIDEDILAWFKASGARYQSRINAVLRSYMDHMRNHHVLEFCQQRFLQSRHTEFFLDRFGDKLPDAVLTGLIHPSDQIARMKCGPFPGLMLNISMPGAVSVPKASWAPNRTHP